MTFFAYHEARRKVASATRLNYAADFTVGAGGQSLTDLPPIGDLDFRLVVRVKRQEDNYAYFVMCNAADNLDTFGIYENTGAWTAYMQATALGKNVFRTITTAAQVPTGTWAEVGVERIGDTMYGLWNGQRVWAQTVGLFTISPLTSLNISYRGGPGGGIGTLHYMDYLHLDLFQNGQWQRWVAYEFNEADYEPATNASLLGGYLQANGNRTGFNHILT